MGELKWICPGITSVEFRGILGREDVAEESISNEADNDIDQADRDSDWESDNSWTRGGVQVVTNSPLVPLVFDESESQISQLQEACFSARRSNVYGSSLWKDIVEEFSSWTFTDDNDRLPAIAGILQSLQTSWNDVCLAGLWRSRLIQDLCWGLC